MGYYFGEKTPRQTKEGFVFNGRVMSLWPQANYPNRSISLSCAAIIWHTIHIYRLNSLNLIILKIFGKDIGAFEGRISRWSSRSGKLQPTFTQFPLRKAVDFEEVHKCRKNSWYILRVWKCSDRNEERQRTNLTCWLLVEAKPRRSEAMASALFCPQQRMLVLLSH